MCFTDKRKRNKIRKEDCVPDPGRVGYGDVSRHTAFEILSNKINGVSEEFRISTFLSGLKDELRIIVTMFKPNTLVAAFGLAWL